MSKNQLLEKLKKILTVSKSVKLERIRQALELDQETFNKKIFDWAIEFGFEIDREYININQSEVNDFVDHLESQTSQ